MAEIIRMPRLSDTMEEGNIVSWLKSEGDSVSPGDILAEVETDKATMDLESFHSGTLLYIGVKEGPVPVDGIIAIIGEKGEDVKALLASAESENPVVVSEVKEEIADAPKAAPSPSPIPVATETKIVSPSIDGRIKASPLAKKMANERGIDIQLITGTGEDGRIIKRDVENFVPSSANTKISQAVNVDPEVQYGDVAVSQMRKVIAKRLSESKFTAPHFYLTIEINMDQAIAARKAINVDENIKVSFNDLVVKAAAYSLRKHPHINASWHGDKMTIHREINIGVAVAVPDGLVVPVLHNTDAMSLVDINSTVRTLAKKARAKKIQPQEMQGNTFTISNLGMFGIEEFTAIINTPDACILAVGGIIQKPIVKDGEIVVGNMMKVTLSCDHRIVDGAVGSQFLNTFKYVLENPVRMLA